MLAVNQMGRLKAFFGSNTRPEYTRASPPTPNGRVGSYVHTHYDMLRILVRKHLFMTAPTGNCLPRGDETYLIHTIITPRNRARYLSKNSGPRRPRFIVRVLSLRSLSHRSNGQLTQGDDLSSVEQRSIGLPVYP